MPTLAQQVAERTALLELLQAITAAANETTSPEAVLQLALDQICAYTGWPVGHVYLAASDGSGLWMSSPIWHLDTPARFAAFQQATQALHMPMVENDIIGPRHHFWSARVAWRCDHGPRISPFSECQRMRTA
jgi:GAF domain-containing protein